MSMWTAIFLIVLVACITGAWKRGKRADAEIQRRAEELPSEREKQLEGEVTELRERIQVLERIATDANSSEAREAKRIAAEIESLRQTDKEA